MGFLAFWAVEWVNGRPDDHQQQEGREEGVGQGGVGGGGCSACKCFAYSTEVLA